MKVAASKLPPHSPARQAGPTCVDDLQRSGGVGRGGGHVDQHAIVLRAAASAARRPIRPTTIRPSAAA